MTLVVTKLAKLRISSTDVVLIDAEHGNRKLNSRLHHFAVFLIDNLQRNDEEIFHENFINIKYANKVQLRTFYFFEKNWNMDFEIDESTYQEFKVFVREKDFDFDTDADRQLEILSRVVSDEAYESYLNDDLKALDLKLEGLKDKDLDHHKSEIKRLLRQEIISRYYFKKGTIEASFSDDPEILEAVKVLSDQDLYQASLKGNTN